MVVSEAVGGAEVIRPEQLCMESTFGRPLLILDLDETLIHATTTPLDRPPDFVVGPYAVYKRPYVDRFLAGCATAFDLAVWTSATADYAGEIVRRIKPPEVNLAFVWAREQCTRRFDPECQEVLYVKDLKKVKRLRYPLERVLVVDDSPEKLARQYGNLIRVRPYFGEVDDDELVWLEKYLMKVGSSPNYRRVEKRGWRVEFEGQKGV